jgi:hypothetical protein
MPKAVGSSRIFNPANEKASRVQTGWSLFSDPLCLPEPVSPPCKPEWAENNDSTCGSEETQPETPIESDDEPCADISALPEDEVRFLGRQQSAAAVNADATTLVFKNLPQKLTATQLTDVLNELGFAGHYDLCFLAIDRQSGSCKGSAVVNFYASWWAATACVKAFGYKLDDKRMAVSIANTQGVTATLKERERRAGMAKMMVHYWKGTSFEEMTVTQALETHMRA